MSAFIIGLGIGMAGGCFLTLWALVARVRWDEERQQ